MYELNEADLADLAGCNFCPRECGANRLIAAKGYCRTGSGFEIASITVHHGEEPVISGQRGICNVFFSHCNLQCIYCQNYQISSRSCKTGRQFSGLSEVVTKIENILDTGISNVGFVSPSHMIPQMKAIIRRLRADGYHPITVYNTNSYDKAETLRSLEELIDVYLPDFKYSDPLLAKKWSDAKDYFDVAGIAIREMYRQKGNVVHLNEEGIAERGVIVRHLVLPGETLNSINVLKFLAEEISPRISISLMSQYYPVPGVSHINKLNRSIYKEEYEEVLEEMNRLGFTKGWIQGYDSPSTYFPDFDSDTPFK
jgi:putative pyruvate formate lyase activating enzyme